MTTYSNLSKEVGRIRGRSGPMWARRYDGIIVSDEPEAQWNRLRYLLSHSVKEGLCESPLDWPGLHCAEALIHGEKLEGYWFNRGKEWSARNQGKDVGYYDFATKYLVGFAPLPAFRHLPPEEYRARVVELIGEIEEEGRRARDGDPVAGREKILIQNPFEAPTRKTKRSPKPLFHVVSKEARDDLRAELSTFLTQFWDASEVLRASVGQKLAAAAGFPEGCYPPALPFLGSPPPPLPPLPPTRRVTVLESGVVKRGPIPVIEPPVRIWGVVPQARGQPP